MWWLADLTDGRKVYILAQIQLFANAAIALKLFNVSFDVILVGNAALAILIWFARALTRRIGFLAALSDQKKAEEAIAENAGA